MLKFTFKPHLERRVPYPKGSHSITFIHLGNISCKQYGIMVKSTDGGPRLPRANPSPDSYPLHIIETPFASVSSSER